MYVDYNKDFDGAYPYWTITEAGNGNYHIQTLTTHETYGQSAMPGTYLGNNPDKEGNDNDVDGNIFDEEGMNITWQLVPEGPHTAAQTARLQELVTAANGLGLDTSEAETVLNNNEATYINMLDNILELQDRINNEQNNINAKNKPAPLVFFDSLSPALCPLLRHQVQKRPIYFLFFPHFKNCSQ